MSDKEQNNRNWVVAREAIRELEAVLHNFRREGAIEGIHASPALNEMFQECLSYLQQIQREVGSVTDRKSPSP